MGPWPLLPFAFAFCPLESIISLIHNAAVERIEGEDYQ